MSPLLVTMLVASAFAVLVLGAGYAVRRIQHAHAARRLAGGFRRARAHRLTIGR
jgi:hypothetical protein